MAVRPAKPTKKPTDRRRKRRATDVVRIGDISDLSVLRGEVSQLRIDVKLLGDLYRGEMRQHLVGLAQSQRDLSAEVIRVLQTLTTLERRDDDHERRIGALETRNGVAEHGLAMAADVSAKPR